MPIQLVIARPLTGRSSTPRLINSPA